MANIPQISVAAEPIAQIGGVAMSNALLSGGVTLLILGLLVIAVNRRLSIVPGRLQMAMESLLGYFYAGLVDVYGSEERARKYLPLILGLFLFIIIANQFTLIPFTQSIVLEGTSLFRNPTSHFAAPLALALIVFLISHIVAFTISPIKHIRNFIKIDQFFKVRSFKDLGNAFLENFLAILDIIGELAKVVSLSARLFGNVFAGEVMVGVISGLSAYTQFIVPVPFYVLSIFSGVIQALVFAALAMAFLSGMAKSVEVEA